MYKVDIAKKTLTKLSRSNFTALNLLERYDIQEWVEKTPEILKSFFASREGFPAALIIQYNINLGWYFVDGLREKDRYRPQNHGEHRAKLLPFFAYCLCGAKEPFAVFA